MNPCWCKGVKVGSPFCNPETLPSRAAGGSGTSGPWTMVGQEKGQRLWRSRQGASQGRDPLTCNPPENRWDSSFRRRGDSCGGGGGGGGDGSVGVIRGRDCTTGFSPQRKLVDSR